MNKVIEQARRVRGFLKVPGDKSIAHRSLILGAMARGKHVVVGVPHSEDLRSTITCLRELGCFIEEMPDGRTLVLAKSPQSGRSLFAGNSGTTARLLSGFIAGHEIECAIDGDDSLRRRPMARIIEPLEKMGAAITTSPGGRLPMKIRGGRLRGITYRLPVASAQVKSAILIAGLFAEGKTVVEEAVPTRDHTERMLRSMSVPIEIKDGRITVEGGSSLKGIDMKIPGDISSAAYLMIAAACLPDSEIYLPSTGVNPTRAGIIELLRRMGANIEMVNTDTFSEEPVADIIVMSSKLRGAAIGKEAVPGLIDELPVIAVAATQAEGETVVSGAEELRHKESDRIASVVKNLTLMGAVIEERTDGFVVRGPTPLRGSPLRSYGDHRIALAMSIAGLIAEGSTRIDQSEVVDISYPGFFKDLAAVIR